MILLTYIVYSTLWKSTTANGKDFLGSQLIPQVRIFLSRDTFMFPSIVSNQHRMQYKQWTLSQDRFSYSDFAPGAYSVKSSLLFTTIWP